MSALRVLVDMDGVIANWGKQWDLVLDKFWPESRVPRHAEQTTFDLKAGLDAYDRDVVNMVMDHPNFYRDIEPMPGAADALNAMLDLGYIVHVCSTPWLSNRTCLQDKAEWLDRHIGPGWSRRAIFTSDKTVVGGDILIDDKPQITGSVQPTWEHVIFDQPYNRSVVGPRRIMDWPSWSLELQAVAA